MLTPTLIIAYAATTILTPVIAKNLAKVTGFSDACKKQPVEQDISEEEIEPIDWDEDDTVDPSI